MTALFCSRHQVGWTSPPVLCPACQDVQDAGGKAAHQDRTPQEEADYMHNTDDTPRVNYASSCGTSALVVEAKKLERELAATCLRFAKAETDAIRYRFLRDGEYAEKLLEWLVAGGVHRTTVDAAIDMAMRAPK